MTDIEQKALALVREVLNERNLSDKRAVRREVSPYTEALCRAIEQHEATNTALSATAAACATHVNTIIQLRAELAALDARGLEIREKNDD